MIRSMSQHQTTWPSVPLGNFSNGGAASGGSIDGGVGTGTAGVLHCDGALTSSFGKVSQNGRRCEFGVSENPLTSQKLPQSSVTLVGVSI